MKNYYLIHEILSTNEKIKPEKKKSIFWRSQIGGEIGGWVGIGGIIAASGLGRIFGASKKDLELEIAKAKDKIASARTFKQKQRAEAALNIAQKEYSSFIKKMGNKFRRLSKIRTVAGATAAGTLAVALATALRNRRIQKMKDKQQGLK